ncbi:MAG: PQQ enzyme repeat protein [Candidatus Methanofastidiosum methylothiophilum]|uniref:PQQ enzyme repeat protein n=1 Tax=Candidatus Methanofastidiosum methylothiophilum TaxID=1705564 RepID=A0A150IIK8_9EURY|nr:MAG: PQQ enzyme repeat protein [Candidatus Methanofastidiosum methylthiophilus]KYC46718.1 MAG: PQQ enzyme repeat protein [Candidatus Methanofastidiosum methylthiophilus]KYC49949.1 MAG: PQQ enzyme repeat protein [Candidatus Methanofastidiosum methylthiophilus]
MVPFTSLGVCTSDRGDDKINKRNLKNIYGVILTFLIIFTNLTLSECENEQISVKWEKDIDSTVKLIEISEDGNYIALGSNNQIYLFTNNGKLLWSFTEPSGGIELNSIALTSDCSYLVAGFGRKSAPQSFAECKVSIPNTSRAYLFDKSGKIVWQYDSKNSIDSVTISPKGNFVLIGTGLEEGKAIILDKERKVISEYSLSSVNSFPQIISPDGDEVVIFNYSLFDPCPFYLNIGKPPSQNLYIIKTDKTEIFKNSYGILLDENIIANSISRNKSFSSLAVGGLKIILNNYNYPVNEQGFVSFLWRTKTRNNAQPFDLDKSWSFNPTSVVESVCLSNEGDILVAGTSGYWKRSEKSIPQKWINDGAVYVFKTNESGKLYWSYKTINPVNSVSISSDNNYILAGSNGAYLFDRYGDLIWKSEENDYAIAKFLNTADSFAYTTKTKIICCKINYSTTKTKELPVEVEKLEEQNTAMNLTNMDTTEKEIVINETKKTQETKNTPGFELPAIIGGSLLAAYILNKRRG